MELSSFSRILTQLQLRKEFLMAKRWTPQEIEELRSMARAWPVTEIAEKMDRPVGGVVFKAFQLKVSLRTRQFKTPIEERAD